jgi:shikimate kinase
MITKLKRTPGLYLVGFMGCGKSTVGRHLAGRLGWSFADVDDDIEARQQISISEIFESLGEAVFREIETEALRARVQQIECGVPFVIALGGGAFAQDRNYELIRDNGVSIWLDCPFELIRQRVAQATHRPLARDAERFEALYHARRASYARADFRIEITSEDPGVAVDAILALPVF